MPSHGAFADDEEPQDHSARATGHAEESHRMAEEAAANAEEARAAAVEERELAEKARKQSMAAMASAESARAMAESALMNALDQVEAGLAPDEALDVVEKAGSNAVEHQSPFLRRKDTLTALAVLVGYVVESSARVDWSTATGWAPAVAVWGIAIIGIGIHAFTKGAITPSVVERITAEAEHLARRKL